jgi:hypothetical protein
MAAGFSIGIPAVRSSIPVTSSEACALAAALTGGAFGTLRFFFLFFALTRVAAVAEGESK